MYLDRLKFRIDQFEWYRRKHGLFRLFILTIDRAINKWFVKSKYLFVVDLEKYDPIVPAIDHLKAEKYSSIDTIPKIYLDQLKMMMGPGRAQPFLEHFFGYGARLWLANIENKVVGLRWTLKGGFSGFFCIPIDKNDVVTLAGQVFHQYKGKGIFGKFNSAILAQLKKEGISRVYTGVHCRNRSMLRAVEKANLRLVGRVLTLEISGFHLSLWKKCYLWGKIKL